MLRKSSLLGESVSFTSLSSSHGWWEMECCSCLVASVVFNHMDCSLPGSSVHGFLQARVLEWVAMPSSRGYSWLRDWTWVSCIAGGFSTTKPPGKPMKCTLSCHINKQRCHIYLWSQTPQMWIFGHEMCLVLCHLLHKESQAFTGGWVWLSPWGRPLCTFIVKKKKKKKG